MLSVIRRILYHSSCTWVSGGGALAGAAWTPQTKFDDGIRKTVAWYLDNRAWWEKIISGEYKNYYAKMYDNR